MRGVEFVYLQGCSVVDGYGNVFSQNTQVRSIGLMLVQVRGLCA